MSSPWFDNEKTPHPRFSIILLLEYRSFFDSWLRTGLLSNLSDTGLLFHSCGDMGPGTTLTIKVMFADGFTLTTFQVRAKIIRKDLHFDRDWREYKYGAEFIHISEQDQERLNQLLAIYSPKEIPRGYGISSFRDKHIHTMGSCHGV